MITYLSILLNTLRIDRDDERGASAVEYGLLIAGVAALIVAVVVLFGGNIVDIFNNTCNKVGNGSGTAQTGGC